MENNVKLLKTAHLAQLVGSADSEGNYAIASELCLNFKKMRKIECRTDNQIDVCGVRMFLQSVAEVDGPPVDFIVEISDITYGEAVIRRAVLYLQEKAVEMGGLLAFTYLSAIAVFDSLDIERFDFDMAKEFCIVRSARSRGAAGSVFIPDAVETASIETLAVAAGRRKELARRLLQEQERVCKAAAARAEKELLDCAGVHGALVRDEYNALKAEARRFVRPGKPDFCTSRVQMMDFVIQKNGLAQSEEISSVVKVLQGAERKCERVATKALKDEISAGVVATEPIISKRTIKNAGKAVQQKDAILGKLSGNLRGAVQGQSVQFGRLVDLILQHRGKGTALEQDRRAEFEVEYQNRKNDVLRIYNASEQVEYQFLNEVENLAGEAQQGERQPLDGGTQADDAVKIQRLVSSLVERYRQTKGVDKKTELALKSEYIVKNQRESQNEQINN